MWDVSNVNVLPQKMRASPGAPCQQLTMDAEMFQLRKAKRVLYNISVLMQFSAGKAGGNLATDTCLWSR